MNKKTERNMAFIMIKPHALTNRSMFVSFEIILRSFLKEYGLEIVGEHIKTLSEKEAKGLDKKFHNNEQVPFDTKKKVISALQEGKIKSFWITGDNAYEKCREIRQLLRKSLDADNTSVYNFLHVVDWNDLKTSSKILFDLEEKEITKRVRYTSEIISGYEFLESLQVCVVGRISSIRDLGKIVFFRINDFKGNIQIILKKNKDEKNDISLDDFKRKYKEGDIVSVKGIVKKSKSGEISIFGNGISTILLPSSRINIDYKEIVSDIPGLILLQEHDVRKNVLRRSQIIHACREILINSGNIEIETPILNDIFNGGYSEPYIVRNNNYRKDQYLRVSSELYLKQMIIGGIEGVFEIGKQFRGGDSENISRSEYTSLEFYRAYKDHLWMMEYIEKLFSEISRKVLNKYKIKWFENEVDISKEWKKITFYEAFKEYLGIDIYSLGKEDIKKLFTKNNIVEKDTDSTLLSLFKVTVAPHLKQPTFVYSYPAGISPYSKRNSDFNEQVLKFGGYISGKKIIDGSLEENDAIIVRKNLEKQREEKRKMGVKIYPEDSAFEEALNYGMPPLVGASISIDRMIMFFTESDNIREVNIF